jgi:nucleotide-binding universal stress UspA family protein
MTGDRLGPVLFAYDGSDLAKVAIEEAGRQLAPDRHAVVLTVWRPYAVEFIPARGLQFDAAATDDVRRAAEVTAADGAALAEAAGFRSESMSLHAAPTWKGISRIAEERDADLIVLGSHGRSGLRGALTGTVAGAIAVHSSRPVLIVHKPHH